MAYRSQRLRLGRLISARLFAPPSGETPMRTPPSDPQAAIRTALKRRRRALGLTQAQAAAVLGLRRLAYHRIESGSRRISFTELGAICAAYGCHVGELVQDGQLAHAFTHAAEALLGRDAP